MNTLFRSFLPFTALLLAIVGSVIYFDGLAANRSADYEAKPIVWQPDEPAPAPQVAPAGPVQLALQKEP